MPPRDSDMISVNDGLFSLNPVWPFIGSTRVTLFAFASGYRALEAVGVGESAFSQGGMNGCQAFAECARNVRA